jgi:hypothetical protein
MESFMTRIIVIAAAVLLSSSALAQDKAAQKFLSEAIQGIR